MKILQVATTLQSIQEQRGTPLVETYNKQLIFKWVINNLNLPLVQGQVYTEWEISAACERIILIKSSYSYIIEEFGVPKSTICCTLNVILPPLKFSSLKHIWDLIEVGKITKKIVREVIVKTVVKNKNGKTYLLKYKEAYIVATSEINGAHGLPRYIARLSNNIQ